MPKPKKKVGGVEYQLETMGGAGGNIGGAAPKGATPIVKGSSTAAPKVPKSVNINVDNARVPTSSVPTGKAVQPPDWLAKNISKTGGAIQPQGMPAKPVAPVVNPYVAATSSAKAAAPAAATAAATTAAGTTNWLKAAGGAIAAGTGVLALAGTIGYTANELINAGVFNDVEDTSNLDALAELATAIIENDFEVKNTDGLTLTEIYDAARIAEEVRLLGVRENQRQFAQLQGQGMYSQALMAMEQQRALSDTRGLTAGAREGATQQLSATQQMALGQIQNATMQQLLQIDTEALQDPRMAMEYALRHLEISQTLDPRNAQLNSYVKDAQFKYETGDIEGAIISWNKAMALEAEINGYKPNLSLDPAIAAIEWDRTVQNQLDALNQPPESPEAIQARNFMMIGGLGLMIVGGGMIALTKGAAAPLGTGLIAKGAKMVKMVGGGVALGGASMTFLNVFGWWNNRDRNLSPHEKRVRQDTALNTQIGIWLDAGLSLQEIFEKIQVEYPPESRLPLFR